MTASESPSQHDPFRIAITGAAGILGSSIADCLEGVADKLKIDVPGLPIQIIRISRRLGVDLHRVDQSIRSATTDPDGTLGYRMSPDVVIHCAATPYEPGTHSDYEILSNDLDLTLAALRIASAQAPGRHPPRFVFLSSLTVYGSAPGTAVGRPRPLAETDTEEYPAPSSAIGLAKLMSETAIRAWSKSTGGTHNIWRLSNVISPHEPHDRPGHIVTDLYRKLFVERVPELQLAGGGFQVRAFSWFEDVVTGIVDLMSKPEAENQTFNLGSDTPTSISELARTMVVIGLELGLLPEDYAPVIVFDSGSREDVRIPSVVKARELLGWQHKTSLREMLERFLVAKSKQEGAPVYA